MEEWNIIYKHTEHDSSLMYIANDCIDKRHAYRKFTDRHPTFIIKYLFKTN